MTSRPAAVDRSSRRSRLEVLLLAVLAAASTGAAWHAYPAWDDAWLWLQSLEGGTGVRESLSDRPLLGWLWARLIRADLLLPVSAVVHWAGWLGLGLVTRGLWRRLFPRLASAGVAAALGAMGTVLLQVQHVLVNPVWGSLVGTVLVYAAALATWPAADPRPESVAVLQRAAAVLAVFTAALLSEYGVIAAMVIVVVPAVGLEPGAPRRRARVGLAATTWLVPALVGYGVFLVFSDPATRPDTRPGQLLELGAGRLLALPFLLVTEIWQGALAAWLSAAGTIEAESRESLGLAIGAAIVAAAVYWLARRCPTRDDEPPRGSGARAAVALLAGAAVGLGIILGSGRVPWTGPTSRFYLPIAPVLVCLGLRALQSALKASWHRGAIAAVAFVVTFTTVGDLVALHAEQRRVEDLAPLVEPHLDPEGFSLVVLLQASRDAIRNGTPAYELTGRTARGLPAELRNRLWVVPYGSRELEGVSGVEAVGAPDGPPVLDRALRGMEARIEVTRVVWVEIDRDPPRVTVGERPRAQFASAARRDD